MRTSAAISKVREAIEAGHIVHAKNTDGHAITAGAAAQFDGSVKWVVMRWIPVDHYLKRNAEVVDDDCGTSAGLARVLVREYLGAHVACMAAMRALGEID